MITRLIAFHTGLALAWGAGLVQIIAPGSRTPPTTDEVPPTQMAMTVRGLGCYEVQQMHKGRAR